MEPPDEASGDGRLGGAAVPTDPPTSDGGVSVGSGELLSNVTTLEKGSETIESGNSGKNGENEAARIGLDGENGAQNGVNGPSEGRGTSLDDTINAMTTNTCEIGDLRRSEGQSQTHVT